jgi:hypothetical protein
MRHLIAREFDIDDCANTLNYGSLAHKFLSPVA